MVVDSLDLISASQYRAKVGLEHKYQISAIYAQFPQNCIFSYEQNSELHEDYTSVRTSLSTEALDKS